MLGRKPEERRRTLSYVESRRAQGNEAMRLRGRHPCFLFLRCFSFLIRLFYHLLGDMRRHFLVVGEFHGEGAAAAGHGPQVRGVLQHLRHGNDRLDYLVLALGLHAYDLPRASSSCRP